jgi:hypothetical protein
MKGDGNTNRKAGGNANLPIDTDDFIRQVSFAVNSENMPKSVQSYIAVCRNYFYSHFVDCYFSSFHNYMFLIVA